MFFNTTQEFDRGACNQAVAPGITRPLHTPAFDHSTLEQSFCTISKTIDV